MTRKLLGPLPPALPAPAAPPKKRRHPNAVEANRPHQWTGGGQPGWSVFKRWQENVLKLGADNGGTLDADTLVQVCSKKVIYREYRLWVVKGKIVTASLYKEGTTVRYSDQVDEGVLRYASQFTGHPMVRDSWAPAEAFVLDIAETPDGYKILEAGCINAAGFYAADMQKLVMALEDGFGRG